ncbi:MAG: redoxin domain-containing protein [Elusimicrobia bacterium]|nr:redoxin domain-containing protein [Elusimicrobiota bacterium]
MRRYIAVFILLLSSGAACAQEEARARQILARTLEIYNNLTTYQDTTDTIMTLVSQGIENKISYEYETYIKKPDKFYIKNTSGLLGRTVVSDGNKIWVYQPALKRYMVMDPEAIEDFLAVNTENIFTLGTEQFLIGLFMKDKDSIMLDDQLSISIAGEEEIDGAISYVLNMKKEKLDMKVKIDKKSGHIRMITLNLSDFMEQMMAGAGKEEQDMPKPEILYIESHSGISVNQAISDSYFKFVPPPDSSKVANIYENLNKSPAGYPYIGEPFTDFQLGSLNTRGSIKLSEETGSVIILAFWNAKDSYSEDFLTFMKKLNTKFRREKEIKIILIAPKGQAADAGNLTKKNKVTFPVLYDEDNSVSGTYGVATYPTIFIIGKKGAIQQIYTGYFDGLQEMVEKDISMLLEGIDLKDVEGSTVQTKGIYIQWNVPVKTSDLAADKEEIFSFGPAGNINILTNRGSIKDTLRLKSTARRMLMSGTEAGRRDSFIIYRPQGTDISLVSMKGKKLWDYSIRLGINHAETADLDGDGRQEIILGLNGLEGLRVIDFDSNTVFQSTRIANAANVSAGNLSGDRLPEITAVSNDGIVYILDSSGKPAGQIDDNMLTNYAKIIDFGGKYCNIFVSGSSGDSEILKMLSNDGKASWEVILGNSYNSRVTSITRHPVNNWVAIGTADSQVFVFDSAGNMLAYAREKGMNLLVDWVGAGTGEYNLLTANMDLGINCYLITESESGWKGPE